MVSLVVGFPGSGKSYYAVDKIFNILADNDKMSNDIDIIYSNINGTKFDSFPDSKVQFKKFNEAEFYKYLTRCHSIYEAFKSSDSVDDELIKISKEYGYHKALIVFDECHSFFDGQDKIKIFWLTYHRHLFHEIILLTQNKTLIHSKYRAIPEIFIEAQPRSKKIFSKTLSYKKYSSFAMRKMDFFGKDTITTRDEVFALYQSGNKSNQKSILSKYLYIIIAFSFISFGAFYFIIDSFNTNDEIEVDIIKPLVKKNTVNVKTEHINTNYINKASVENTDYFVITLLCDKYKGCIYINNTYPYNYIKEFVKDTESKIIFRQNIFKSKDKKNNTYKMFIRTSNEDLKKYFILKKDINRSLKRNKKNNDTPILENITSGIRL